MAIFEQYSHFLSEVSTVSGIVSVPPVIITPQFLAPSSGIRPYRFSCDILVGPYCVDVFFVMTYLLLDPIVELNFCRILIVAYDFHELVKSSQYDKRYGDGRISEKSSHIQSGLFCLVGGEIGLFNTRKSNREDFMGNVKSLSGFTEMLEQEDWLSFEHRISSISQGERLPSQAYHRQSKERTGRKRANRILYLLSPSKEGLMTHVASIDNVDFPPEEVVVFGEGGFMKG
ncbi:hypothetical protein HAX54_040265 [Datura stramonium]|uniref:Uncharacterized protein n=1 Tax=Datura stramonium TaxID=4076 RepID=A0ABS8SJU8_DATST|nr:hypothetical protein [Datura stramonium]